MEEKTPAASVVTRHQGGLLAAVSARQKNDLQDVIYEEDGVPYINSDLARKNDQENLNSKFAKLVEAVTSPSPPPALRQQDKP